MTGIPRRNAWPSSTSAPKIPSSGTIRGGAKGHAPAPAARALHRRLSASSSASLDDAVTLIELGEAENDEATIHEGEACLEQARDDAQREQVEALLSGEADGNDTYLEVHAGAGGTESQDWA